MVRYKEIEKIFCSVILLLSLIGCSTQNTSYSGLYIDSNFKQEASLETEGMTSEKKENLQPHDTDTIVSLGDQKRFVTTTSDSTYFKTLIYENRSSLINDSTEKKHSKETSILENKNRRSQSKAEDSITKTNLQTQLKEFKKLQKQIDEDKNSLFRKDSTFTLTEAQKLQVLGGNIESKKDSVKSSSKVNTEQSQIQNTDTVFIVREIYMNTETKKGNSSEKEKKRIQAEKKNLKKEIERLESLNKVMQEKEPVYIEKEVPAKEAEETKKETVETTYREVIRDKTTERQSMIPVSTATPQVQPDTVFIKKEVPVRETIVLENESDKAVYEKLNSQNDTIKQLKDQLSQKELIQQKTDTVYKINEVPVYKTKEIDSVTVTAFYERGKTVPSNDIINELKEKLRNKSIENVMLSGYTDASGNKSINKALTDKRLEYIKELMTDIVPIHKIYVQNFGDAFASSEIVPTERRVEITVYLKPKNEEIKN